MIRYLTLLLCTAALAVEPVMREDQFDAMMRNYWTNGVPDVIKLGPGLHLTRGSVAWEWGYGDSLVGAGMTNTTIKRMDPRCVAVINGWQLKGGFGTRISDLTIDANAMLACDRAASGISGLNWRDSVIERVRVIGLGSFIPESESFGIILSDSTNCVIHDCAVERNVGGYVSAYTISGNGVYMLDNVARFVVDPEWDVRYQAFCTAGGKSGSRNVWIMHNTCENALFAIFSDTGPSIDYLTLAYNSGTMKNAATHPAQAIRLTGTVKYTNIRTNNNTFILK